MRLSPLVALGLAGLLALAPAADAKHHRCAIRGGSVFAKDRQAEVLTRDTQNDVENDTEYWGCVRSSGRRVFIDSAASDQYGQTDIGFLQLRGWYVAYASDTNAIDNSCHGEVDVFSLKRRSETGNGDQTGLPGNTAPDCPAVAKLLLTPTGRAAWTATQGQDSVVRKIDPSGDATLDPGPVDTASLKLTAAGLASWTDAGQPHSAQLR